MVLTLAISKGSAPTKTKEVTISGFTTSLIVDTASVKDEFDNFHITTLSTTKSNVLPSSIAIVPTTALLGATLPVPTHGSIFS